MHNLGFALDGAWQVLAAGLLLGAGLPALFAVGIRAMASTTHRAGRVVGIACFAVVVLGALLGIAFIVASGFGLDLTFEHGYPTVE
ncbi:hypothetical protein GCM10009557_62980 [Virgisporangium ochraceum]|uniref:Uncharacterized protein n=1 Tax=Virgisporangium ochraceum TaxID=65505 RepID=A0A8J4EGE1_9ACTN|nr:hypothetical protein [Virgisporangium ochraceum]GIJ73588.1 hypothetical protein Voc01_085050 [Virgisporangium ochraceum]